ncbi:MAG: type II toxin-antitoxin system VapC family toxin [Candidatus Rokubacteria bacterium]|nr:type II toxin-antitoxin system VapC family toxin [Candidatus Rokubacteria bacterium]
MFWDSSAIVPILLAEARSAVMASLLRSDPEFVLWWASPVECQSALYRLHRENRLSLTLLDPALLRLKGVVEDADFIAPTTRVRERAGRLLAAHPLRAADALQLAAALVWCDETPRGDRFVCLDERLRNAARREGFAVLPT